MNRTTDRWLSLLLALILALSGGFAAAEALPAQEQAEPFGSPWITGVVSGNLPAEAPSPRDDLYLSVNYGELAAHQQDLFYMPMMSAATLQPAVIGMIHDETFTAPGMDQLRIFWQQAADDEALKKEGLDGVMPYISRILAAESLEALNAVLLADDFPFSPYLFMTVTPESLQGRNITYIMPALSLSDNPMLGIEAYDAPVASIGELSAKANRLNMIPKANAVIQLLGFEGQDSAGQAVALYNAEFSYAGFYPRTETLQNAEYGAVAGYMQILPAEEIEKLCSSFPLTKKKKKFGKDVSPAFSIATPDWLSALDALWTEENLDLLKTLTAYKVLIECSSYVSQEIFNQFTRTPLIAEGNAWNACDRAPTFSVLLAQLFAENVLGSGVKDKLTEVTCGLLDEYRKMFSETEWISEETRADAIEKIGSMQLNILGPKDGYMDFSGLQLKSSEEGGTLLGNYLAVKAYRNELDNRLIGQPATADLFWRVSSPSMINCFYDPASNSINILPNFISPLTWWDGITEMEILGGIGTVIGHELGHGFDYTGSQVNGYAVPEPVLHGNDSQEFVARVNAVVDYFNGITILPGFPTDGNRLKVENGADLAGMRAALSLAASREDADLAGFFAMYAKMYVQVVNISFYPAMLMEDTHAPNHLRVNVFSQMMPEYAETFGVTEGDGMYVAPENRLVVWGK